MKKVFLMGTLLFATSLSFTETPPPRPVYCDCVGIGMPIDSMRTSGGGPATVNRKNTGGTNPFLQFAEQGLLYFYLLRL